MSVLVVAPVTPAPRELLPAIEAALARAFAMAVTQRDPIPEPEDAYSPDRGQWSSAAFLRRLVRHLPPAPGRLLGVTERDLYVPVLSFVYGQAQLQGRAAVVSVARLRSEFHGLPTDPALLARRVAAEAVHEVGHTFGLSHCLDRGCPMSLSVDLPDLDHKGADLCRSCSALLEGSTEMKRVRVHAGRAS